MYSPAFPSTIRPAFTRFECHRGTVQPKYCISICSALGGPCVNSPRGVIAAPLGVSQPGNTQNAYDVNEFSYVARRLLRAISFATHLLSTQYSLDWSAICSRKRSRPSQWHCEVRCHAATTPNRNLNFETARPSTALLSYLPASAAHLSSTSSNLGNAGNEQTRRTGKPLEGQKGTVQYALYVNMHPTVASLTYLTEPLSTKSSTGPTKGPCGP